MRVLNTTQMREADRRTIEEIGLPSLVLMENAGRQVVAAMESAFDDLAAKRIAVLCGRGNNGGDGFVVARTLLERSIDVSVYLLARPGEVRGDARTNLDVLGALGVDVIEISDASAWELHGTAVAGADLVVDALFGTGLKGPLTGWIETVIADLNAGQTPVVSIDLPSGLSADSQDVSGPAVHAHLTVTLAAPKLPLVLPPADALAGHLVIAEIGIPRAVVSDLGGPWVELLTKEAMRALIPPRPTDSHKGDYGRVLVVAGSRGKAGAAHLTSAAALRSGAGLVTVGTPASCLAIVAGLGAEIMTDPLDESADGTVAFEALEHVLESGPDIIAVGPGLGRAPSTTAFVHGLVERSSVSLVLDADALNAFAGEADRLVGRDGIDIVMTPHPGEMARLTGLSIEDVQARRLNVACDFAVMHHVYVILKGHRTIVATPAGKAFINPTGNPGMATAGSGDVLTGMVAAWCAQLHDTEAACKVAVYLHGLAGNLAEAESGDEALIAGDIISHLGAAVLDLTGRSKEKTR